MKHTRTDEMCKEQHIVESTDVAVANTHKKLHIGLLFVSGIQSKMNGILRKIHGINKVTNYNVKHENVNLKSFSMSFMCLPHFRPYDSLCMHSIVFCILSVLVVAIFCVHTPFIYCCCWLCWWCCFLSLHASYFNFSVCLRYSI